MKAIEYAADGVTVRRVEFKCAADYAPVLLPGVGYPFLTGAIGGGCIMDAGRNMLLMN